MQGKNIKSIVVAKPDAILKGRIRLPASKSISNRLLMIGALCGKNFPIGNLSEADDTILLQKLITLILAVADRSKVVELDTGNAGTVMRFLTAWLAMVPGKWLLTGSDRMKQRPIGILVDALNHLGASIDYLAKPGYPPLLIRGRQLTHNELVIDPGVSSQFTTALLLIAPYLPQGLILTLKGSGVSSPYVKMTIKLMQSYGAVIKEGKTRIHVKPGLYRPHEFQVESDWSAAAFWYEACVLADVVDIELIGLLENSIQGDAILPGVFLNFGIISEFTPDGLRLTKVRKMSDGFYFDFTDYPDIAQAVIAACAGMGIRGRFEGLKSLQIKETDRLLALKNEISKLGISVELSTHADILSALEIKSSKSSLPGGLTFETYGDHRMAMALAPLALKSGSVKILNPDVVVKSYPHFWKDLQRAGFEIY
ncbi:MAG: 3-phosphoshikimate 1-carboxyvinyltransferase [Bacteroidota bacterium]